MFHYRLVHVLVDPVYRTHSGLCPRVRSRPHLPPDNEHFPAPAVGLEQLDREVVPILLALGPHAKQDPVLLIKVRLVSLSAPSL